MSSKILLYYEIFQRIEQVREALGINQYQFSKKLRISASFYSEIKKKRSDVNSTLLIGLVRSYPKVNIYWVITGDGEMFKTEFKIADKSENYGKNTLFEGIPDDKIDDFKALINSLKRLFF